MDWRSRNNRANLKIRARDNLTRFSKESGQVDMKLQDALIVIENFQRGKMTVIAASNTVVTEDEEFVYVRISGRQASSSRRLPVENSSGSVSRAALDRSRRKVQVGG